MGFSEGAHFPDLKDDPKIFPLRPITTCVVQPHIDVFSINFVVQRCPTLGSNSFFVEFRNSYFEISTKLIWKFGNFHVIQRPKELDSIQSPGIRYNTNKPFRTVFDSKKIYMIRNIQIGT